MNDFVATVTIITDNGPVRINESDFDATKHTLADGSEMTQPPAVAPVITPTAPAVAPVITPTAPAVATQTGENGNPPPSGADTGDKQTNGAGDGSTPAETLLVLKKGKKFLVVNQAGEPVTRDGIDKEGYADEPGAWAAITAVTIAKSV